MIYIKKELALFFIFLIFINASYALAYVTGREILTPPNNIITQYKASDAAKYFYTFKNIKANENNKFINTKNEIAIDYIKFALNKDISDLKVTVIKPVSFQENFVFPEGFIYQIFEVIFKDAQKSDFKAVTLRFKVPKKWLTQKGLIENEIKLLKYDNQKWQEIGAQYIKKESSDYIYEAQIDGFSFFAIVAPFKKPTTKTSTIENKSIMSQQLCGNTIIENDENCLNCPQDVHCQPDETCDAGVCIRKIEAPYQEPHLEEPTQLFSPETNKKNYLVYLISFGVVILGLFIAFFIYVIALKNRKTQLSTPEENEFQLLKRYMKEFKRQGYSVEEIKIGAIRSNWPEDLVNKALGEIK